MMGEEVETGKESKEPEVKEKGRYGYMFSLFEMSKISTEKELKEKYPEVCNPGEHDWKPGWSFGIDQCSKCTARRDARY